jgi:MoaA/NifB/PqqE/SkfB family radical SAM enzyme
MDIYLLQRIYRGLGNAKLRLAALRAARLFGVRTLLVRMDLNNYCNIRCIMCPLGYEAPRGPDRRVMKLEQFERIAADLFPQTRSLVLSCGYEPLIVPDFEQCLAIARRYAVPFVSLATNAMRLDERIARALIEQRINEIVVSADSPDPETFESIRVGAKFQTVMANVSRLAQLKGEQKSALPALRVNYTVMDRNVAQIPAFIEMFADLGLSLLELRPVERRDPIVVACTAPLLTERGAADYRRLLPQIQELCRRRNIRLLALPELAAHDEPAPQPSRSGPNNCILPWLCCYIGANGDFSPCAAGPLTGNLLADSYRQIMKKTETVDFLRCVRSGNPYCDRCFLKSETIG